MIRLVDAHGVSLGVDQEELQPLYDELWEMTDMRGSLPAVAKVRRAMTAGELAFLMSEEAFDEREVAAVQEALARLRGSR